MLLELTEDEAQGVYDTLVYSRQALSRYISSGRASKKPERELWANQQLTRLDNILPRFPQYSGPPQPKAKTVEGPIAQYKHAIGPKPSSTRWRVWEYREQHPHATHREVSDGLSIPEATVRKATYINRDRGRPLR